VGRAIRNNLVMYCGMRVCGREVAHGEFSVSQRGGGHFFLGRVVVASIVSPRFPLSLSPSLSTPFDESAGRMLLSVFGLSCAFSFSFLHLDDSHSSSRYRLLYVLVVLLIVCSLEKRLMLGGTSVRRRNSHSNFQSRCRNYGQARGERESSCQSQLRPQVRGEARLALAFSVPLITKAPSAQQDARCRLFRQSTSPRGRP